MNSLVYIRKLVIFFDVVNVVAELLLIFKHYFGGNGGGTVAKEVIDGRGGVHVIERTPAVFSILDCKWN